MEEEVKTVVIVDKREPKSLRDLCDDVGANDVFKVVQQNHDVGDFIIEKNRRTHIVIERKTWADLTQSLNSRHLDEQLSRMLPFCTERGAKAVLLIECASIVGWPDALSKRLDCFLLKKAISGLTVLRTRDERHTVQTVVKLARMIAEQGIDALQKIPEKYVAYTAAKKRDNMTRSAVWVSMLERIHGISASKAELIANFANSPQSLITKLMQQPEKKRKRLISDSVDGIGAVLSKRICDAFIDC
mgnify:CR=1 FL=1